jgi:hypothetical protein
MDQVEIDIQQRGSAGLVVNDVVVPNLLAECS